MQLVYNPRVVRSLRLDSGKTLEEVAYRAGCSYMHMRRLEDGTARNPSAALLARIAAVYGRDVGELFTPDPDPASAR
jgi:transcriptional regulator with XRE-family HTH domain